MAAAGTGKSYTDENTVLLIRSDTTDGSQTFEDLSDYGHTLTQPQGSLEHKTTQSKMGASSMYSNAASDCVKAPAHSAFNFGTGDFTVEFWIRPTSTGGNKWYFEMYNGSNTSYNNLSFYHESTSYIRSNFSTHGSNYNLAAPSGYDTVNVWHHYAFVRYGTKIQVYIDGTALAEYLPIGTNSMFTAGNPSIVLAGRGETGGQSMTGYYDEFKVSNIARYTSNFTPSSEFDYV